MYYEHDKSGILVVDKYLRLPQHSDVFVLCDCAYVLDWQNKPYSPTAQHVIREVKIMSKNLIFAINGNNQFFIFNYYSKGSMVKIGKRDSVAKMLGVNLIGFIS